jgi:ubiquinone/menaquinone biosynthesis C-methylase UbiE
MKDLKSRIGGMSAEKRELLEKLLKKKGMELPMASQEKHEEESDFKVMNFLENVATDKDPVEVSGPVYKEKETIQSIYNSYHDQLQSTIMHQHSFYMNIGYVADDSTRYSMIELPEQTIGRNYISLILETIGDCDINGHRMLDVGCGRGGAIHAARKYFQPGETVGLDLSSGAIEFCNSRHKYPNTRFLQGDAENLPFADGSFDVVTNIESSHHYQNIEKFYQDVYRVLSSGGYFLSNNLFETERIEQDKALLQQIGFTLVREQDITQNVLAACDYDHDKLFQGLDSSSNADWIGNAVSAPGSETYNYMKDGTCAYVIFKLQKTH